MLLVPFEARLVVLGKRVDALEGRLLILCLTDQQLGKTLMEQVIYKIFDYIMVIISSQIYFFHYLICNFRNTMLN